MFGTLLAKLKNKSGNPTVADLEVGLREALDLPSVYSPEIISKSSGRRAAKNKSVTLKEIDAKSFDSIAALRAEIERIYEDDDLSFRLTSPTDKDGVSDRMHFKTLRDA